MCMRGAAKPCRFRYPPMDADDGGSEPRWSGNGRELSFLSGNLHEYDVVDDSPRRTERAHPGSLPRSVTASEGTGGRQAIS